MTKQEAMRYLKLKETDAIRRDSVMELIKIAEKQLGA